MQLCQHDLRSASFEFFCSAASLWHHKHALCVLSHGVTVPHNITERSIRRFHFLENMGSNLGPGLVEFSFVPRSKIQDSISEQYMHSYFQFLFNSQFTACRTQRACLFSSVQIDYVVKTAPCLVGTGVSFASGTEAGERNWLLVTI